jgi:hypothetical protein
VRAEPLSSPPASMRVIRETAGPVAMPARPPDRASLVRELQTAMTRAGCYHGPINAVWTASSKQAMSAFLIAVNAQLPVDNPDQTLLALTQSNTAAKCVPEQAIDTGAASASMPAANEISQDSRLDAKATQSEMSPNSSDRASSNDSPMIERAWAPAEMLVPPKPVISPPEAAIPLTVGSVEPVLQSDASPSTDVQDIPGKSGEREAQLTPAAASQASPAPKVAQRRAKSRRRQTSDYDDVSRSISKGLNSIQRSLSSVFD